jgi:hypothetical protein
LSENNGLYRNYQDRPINTHSYSSGLDLKTCPALFRLRRKEGWRSVEERAALSFGKVVEAGVQFFHENNLRPGGGVDEFKRFWLLFENKEMKFTVKEGSWSDLYLMGSEMLALYEVLISSGALELSNPRFQVQYRKEVFPGTELAGIEFVGWADAVAKEGKGFRLWDIKTAANGYSISPGLTGLDPQLGAYAWASGILQVGFLVFVKARPHSFTSGDKVTLLKDSGNWKAGASGLIFPLPKVKKTKAQEEEPEPEEESTPLFTLISAVDYEAFKIANKDVRGKALDAAKIAFAEGRTVTVARDSITKQRIQIIKAEISEQIRLECGERIGHEIGEIRDKEEENYWPKQPSVRPPNNKCGLCDMLAICSGDKETAAKKLVQIVPVPAERDWLDELEEGE